MKKVITILTMAIFLSLGSAGGGEVTAISQSCVPAPLGLIGWWPGDTDGSDIQAGNDGRLTNGALAGVAGMVDGAFSFDGVNDYVQLPFDSGIFTDQFTIDAWAFPTKLTRFAFLQGIFDNDVGTNRGMTLGVFGGVPFTFGGTVLPNPFSVTGNFHNPDGTVHSIVLPSTPNQWNHYALTYDGSQLCFYQNGVQETCVAASGSVKDNNVNFRIGHGQSDTAPQRFFGGKIDEVEIYNRALTANEITDIFLAGSAGKCKGPMNQPPVAICQDVVVLVGSNCMAEASIDNGSFDPAGDPITLTQDPSGPYPLGITEVMLIVEDADRAADTCMATVTVVDDTPPVVSCSATPVGGDDDDDDDGRLHINFSASDNCDSVSVSAVIKIGCQQIPVTNGQIIELECDDDECETEFDDSVLEIESNTAVLIVTATDAAGNTATCTVDLCPAGDDDDDDDDDDVG